MKICDILICYSMAAHYVDNLPQSNMKGDIVINTFF